MEHTPELLAYCAGVMDSDGHIGVHVNSYRVRAVGDAKQPTYQPRCAVKQIDPEAIELFHELFAGHRYLDDKNRKGSARPIHIWQVHSRATKAVLEAIRPYLRIKTKQADLALELCAINGSPRRRLWVIPSVVEGEPMVPLADAAALAGRSYAVGIQCVKLGNIPFVRESRRIFVPESFIPEWKARGRGPMRHPDVTRRMAEIEVEIKSLNSGVRGQRFPAHRERKAY